MINEKNNNFKLALLLVISLVTSLITLSCTKRNPVAPESAFNNLNLTPTPGIVNLVMLDDGEGLNTSNDFGGYWYVFDDQGNGGDSQVFPNPFMKVSSPGTGANNSDGYMKMTGTVTDTIASAFVGIGTNLDGSGTMADLSQYVGIKLYIKGDGKKYRLKIQANDIQDYDFFGVTLSTTTEWKEHVIYFNEFRQEGFGVSKLLINSLTSATALQWQTVGQPLSSINLSLDDIYFIQ